MRPERYAPLLALLLLCCMGSSVALAEQRNDVSYLRGPYNTEFYDRHRTAYEVSSVLHVAHGLQHDVLLLTPLSRNEEFDQKWEDKYLRTMRDRPRTEPTQEVYAPFTARHHWLVLRAIDWTHMHHEQTYDIMADPSIAWDRKKDWLERSVRYYLTANDIPRSTAPLDVTMRRAGVMMKPYFSYFRNHYPRSNNFFYFAHWWHPVIYEAMMVGGNGPGQKMAVDQTNALIPEVLANRPQRMLLSRELMPRWSRLDPESANIFDNLHMLHGIVYDIMAYEGWTLAQKRAELYRVVHAMEQQPGDEALARKFPIPHPEMDPREYEPWMQTADGEMSRIMLEMMDEMMPVMMPGGMSDHHKQQMMEQVRMKLTPGLEEGENPGSLHDAVKQMMPDMQMMPESMEPGATPTRMIEAMLQGWHEKYGDMPDVAPMPMDTEPTLSPTS